MISDRSSPALIDQALHDAATWMREDAPALRSITLSPGETVGTPRFPGRYRIQREVHCGTQGVVYEALETEGGERVALKVLRGFHGAPAVQALRFEREVEALRCIDHADVVRVRDSGVVDGCPFLVMDFVDGRALDRMLAEDRPSRRRRVELFQRIAAAVGAAHLRGVIHRDLKPGNILIDESGAPRVLDFGLAKFQHTADVHATQVGQFLGSLPWASPEQASGHHDRIDVRTDVYALGVILYTMLTDVLPHEPRQDVRALLADIAHRDPVRPTARDRTIEPDLETVVLHCMHKDPGRRYQSAGELARDVHRYLTGDPIAAQRDSGWYMLRKLMHRHRGIVAVIAVGVLTLVGFSGGAAVLWSRAESERDRAEAARGRALAALDEAERARQEAQEAAVRADAVTAFLQEMLRGFDPSQAAGSAAPGPRAVQVSEVLEQATRRLADGQVHPPAVAIQIHQTLAQTYRDLGRYEEADRHYRKAVESLAERHQHHRHAAATHTREALSALMAGSSTVADELRLREAVETVRTDFGDDAPQLVSLLTRLAGVLRDRGDSAGGAEMAERALALARAVLGDADPTTADALATLAWFRVDQWRMAEAEELHRAALAVRERLLGADHPRTADSHADLGWMYQRQYQLDAAEAQFHEALAIYTTVHGTDSLRVADMNEARAGVARAGGDLTRAEALLRTAMVTRSEQLGHDHPRVALTLDSLGWVLMEQGELDAARPVLEQALAIRQTRLGIDHPHTAMSLQSVAALLMRRGDCVAAEPLFAEAVRVAAAALGDAHEATAQARIHHADVLWCLGQGAAARAGYAAGIAALQDHYGHDHLRVGEALVRLGAIDLAQDDTAAAREHLGAAHRMLVDEHGPTEWKTAEAAALLSEAVLRDGDAAGARDLLVDALPLLREQLGDGDPRTRRALTHAVAVYGAVGDREQADWFRAVLEAPSGPGGNDR